MVLEDAVQRSGEGLLQRIREQTEPEVRRFISELLTAAAKERGTALEQGRQLAEEEREQAVRAEGARVRDEVERTWATRLQAAADAERERHELDVHAAREEADRQLAERVASVRAEGQRVLEAALEAARAEWDRTLLQRVSEVRTEAERTMGKTPASPGPVTTPRGEPESGESLTRVCDGVRRLDQARSLSDVLDTLATLAGDEAPRAGVLTVQDKRVRGWRFVGFGSALRSAQQVDLPLGQAGIVGHSAMSGESRAVVSGPGGVPEEAEPAFTTVPTGAHALAVPVMVRGEVTAIVYGDDGARRPGAGWRESLEILARHAGHCLEGLTVARLAQLGLMDARAVAAPEPG